MDEVDQLFQEEELSLTKQILTHTNRIPTCFYSATADRVVNQAQSLSQKLQVIDVTEEDTSAGQVAHYFIRLAPRKKLITYVVWPIQKHSEAWSFQSSC